MISVIEDLAGCFKGIYHWSFTMFPCESKPFSVQLNIGIEQRTIFKVQKMQKICFLHISLMKTR